MDTSVDTISTNTTATHDRKSRSVFSPSALNRLLRKKSVLAALGLIVVSAAGWTTVNLARSAKEIAGITRYTVAPQSFSVVLKEKGELQAAKSTDIISQVEGRATIISLIPEGTAVKKGDLLIKLASDQIEDRIQQEELKESNAITAFEAAKAELDIQRDKNASDIRKAHLKIELKKLELEKYEKGVWTQKRKDARIAIDQAKITLDRRKQDYEAAKELRERGFITQTEYDEDEFNFQKAIWDLEKAEKAKEVLEQYTHVADLRQRQSDVEEAVKESDRIRKNAEAEETKKMRSLEGNEKELELIRDQLAKLRKQKKNCTILAPTQGFVVYYAGGGGRHFMSNDNQIREGATVYERQILLSLPDTSVMIVVVRVHEAKTDKLKIGRRAVIKVEGIPDQQFTGTVTKIAVLADSQNRWLNPDLKEYETEITLDPNDIPLKPGVTAYAEIMVETVENHLAIPVQTIYNKNARRYVFRNTGAKTDFVEVKLGAIGTEWAEVTDGLSTGDNILLAFGDEEKRKIPDLGIGQRRSSMSVQRMKQEYRTDAPPSAKNNKYRGGRAHKSSTKPVKHGRESSTMTTTPSPSRKGT